MNPFLAVRGRRGARILASILAIAVAGCAINPRPTFDETSARVKARTGLETTWMRSEAEERATLERVRDLLSEPLSPRRAAQIALVNNRGLQAKLEELGIAQANAVAAGLPGNPEIEGFLGWPSERGADKKIEWTFGFDILDLLVLPSRKKLAALELKQTKALAGHEIMLVAAEAQTGTYELQAVEASLVVTSTAIEIEEALTEFAGARFKAGTLALIGYEEEQGRLDELRASRAMLALESRHKREALNETLGLWGELTTWTVEPLSSNLPDVDPDGASFESLAIEQRFDLAAARAAIDLLAGTLKLQKGTRLLPAGVRVGVSAEKEGDVKLTGPTVQLQLPIFNPGRAETARVEALYLQAQRLFEDRAIRARAEVRQKRDQLFGSRELLRYFEGTVGPRKARIVEMTRSYYNMMLRGADDLLRAKRDEVEAELALIDARRSYWVARTELALALGGSIPEPAGGDAK